MKYLITLLVISAIGIANAKADSDGYFCSSPTFLAYEFSFSKEPVDQHRLYVIHFGDATIPETQWLTVPAFQVHSLRCFSDRVEIIGWDKRYIYSVSLNGIKPVGEENLPIPGKLPEGFVTNPGNLGGFSPVTRGTMPSAYTYTLTTGRPDGNYEIRLQRRQTDNPCLPVVESTLIKAADKNRVIATRTLYNGTVPIECGE